MVSSQSQPNARTLNAKENHTESNRNHPETHLHVMLLILKTFRRIEEGVSIDWELLVGCIAVVLGAALVSVVPDCPSAVGHLAGTCGVFLAGDSPLFRTTGLTLCLDRNCICDIRHHGKASMRKE